MAKRPKVRDSESPTPLRDYPTVDAHDRLVSGTVPAPVKSRPGTVPAVLDDKQCCFSTPMGRCPNPMTALIVNVTDKTDYTLSCDKHVKALRRPNVDEAIRSHQDGWPWKPAPVISKK